MAKGIFEAASTSRINNISSGESFPSLQSQQCVQWIKNAFGYSYLIRIIERVAIWGTITWVGGSTKWIRGILLAQAELCQVREAAKIWQHTKLCKNSISLPGPVGVQRDQKWTFSCPSLGCLLAVLDEGHLCMRILSRCVRRTRVQKSENENDEF